MVLVIWPIRTFEIPICFWFCLMSLSNLFLKFGKFLVLYLGCGCMTFNFTTQITLHHLLPIPMNKNLSGKTARFVKRKSNLNFIRVIRNLSFDQRFLYVYMIKTFLKIICFRFLAPCSEHLLVSSVTLPWFCLCILTLSMLINYKENSRKNFRHACVCIWLLRGLGGFRWIR